LCSISSTEPSSTTTPPPLIAFTPCALSNTMSSWSQYASLKVWCLSQVQTVFKSSKIIPVMMMGKLLKGTKYPVSQSFGKR
jgi:adenosine 3'-phospho 5'-phosphosulfate transporter B2